MSDLLFVGNGDGYLVMDEYKEGDDKLKQFASDPAQNLASQGSFNDTPLPGFVKSEAAAYMDEHRKDESHLGGYGVIGAGDHGNIDEALEIHAGNDML